MPNNFFAFEGNFGRGSLGIALKPHKETARGNKLNIDLSRIIFLTEISV
jgi:hypothetical protein